MALPPAPRLAAALWGTAWLVLVVSPAIAQPLDLVGVGDFAPRSSVVLRRRTRPWALTLQGTASFVRSPSGALGLPRRDAMRWDRIEYAHEPWDALGGRAALSVQFDDAWRAEVRVSLIEAMGDGSHETGTVTYRPPVTTTPFVPAFVRVVADYTRTQINVWRRLPASGGRWVWEGGAGLRVASFSERASAVFAEALPGRPAPALLESDVGNLIIAPQVGVAASCGVLPRLALRASLLVSAGVSIRDVAVSDHSFLTSGSRRDVTSRLSPAWGVAFELSGQWRLTRQVSLVAGYEFLALSSVQRADEAFDFTRRDRGAITARDHTDVLVGHTLALGLRIDF